MAAASIASLVALATPASAETGTWVQQYQRASQTATCGTLPGQTAWQASFTGEESWTPSYAAWANNNTGGWICTRTIVWAQLPTEAPAPTDGAL